MSSLPLSVSQVAQCTLAGLLHWEQRTSARTKTHRQRAPPRNYYNVHVVLLEIGCWWRALSVIMQPASGACTGIAYASFSGGAARCRVCLHFDYTGSGCEEGGGRKCAGSVLIAFMYVCIYPHTLLRNICISIGKFLNGAYVHGMLFCMMWSFVVWNSGGERRGSSSAKSVLQISFSEIVIIFISLVLCDSNYSSIDFAVCTLLLLIIPVLLHGN